MNLANKRTLNTAVFAVFVYIFVVAILYLLAYIKGFAPFGGISFACMDARIQYVDFFSYLQRALHGETSFAYNLEKILGSNNIAVIAYYLTSPFNFLVLFFQQQNFDSLFTLLVALKLALAGVTMLVYLRHRFDKMQWQYAIILSCCYALGQYSFAQASNIMWIDGVYMLPLILLATYRLTKNPAHKPMLIITIGLSIIFNWYSGLINVVYACFYYLYEDYLNNGWATFKQFILRALRFAVCVAFGLGLSMFLLFPSMLALMGGRAGIDFNFIDFSLVSGIGSVISEYYLGATSDKGQVSLYCGFVVLVGLLSWVICGLEDKRTRYANFIFLALNILIFFVPVLLFLFCLAKYVSSYWYRHSYVGIFGIIVLASRFFAQLGENKITVNYKKWWAVIILVVFCIIPNDLYSILFLCATMAVVIGLVVLNNKKVMYNTNDNINTKAITINQVAITIVSIMLCCITLFELGISGYRLMSIYRDNDVQLYKEYVQQQDVQLNELMRYDDGFYRITQTSTFNYNQQGITANYNEALAYGYNSISGYTSDPDERTRQFLHRIGYNIMGDNMNIVVTSIVGADSLLGVKYVLTEKQINGYQKIDNISDANGKSAYYNPYALPMSFVFTPNDIVIDNTETNPFLYQNQLYSYIMGEEVELWKEATYKANYSSSISIDVDIPNANFAMYAQIEVDSNSEYKTVTVNGTNATSMGGWLSTNMIYLPQDQNGKINVKVNHDKIDNLKIYWIDLDLLQTVTQTIQNQKIDVAEFNNGNVNVKVNGNKGQYAYFSMAYDNGLKVKVNGKKVDFNLVGDCMVSVPLVDGENHIEISFSMPGLVIGILATLISIAVIVVFFIFAHQNKKVLEAIKNTRIYKAINNAISNSRRKNNGKD